LRKRAPQRDERDCAAFGKSIDPVSSKEREDGAEDMLRVIWVDGARLII